MPRLLTLSSALLVLLMMNLSGAEPAPSPVVIIHGAWGGAHHWKEVTNKLTQQHGHAVRRAALTGLGERSHLASPEVDLKTHILDVVNLIRFDDLRSVTLVAHSYGGVVAAGVVDEVPDRVTRVLHLDSHLLDNGEAYLTHHPELLAQLTRRAQEAGDGWLVPVDWPNPFRDVPHPLATLTQPLELQGPTPASVTSSYWLFTDGGAAEDDERFRYLERAKQRGWPVRALDWDHNPQRTRPAELAEELDRHLLEAG